MKRSLYTLSLLVLMLAIAGHVNAACGARCSDYDNAFCESPATDSDCSIEEWDAGTGTACMVPTMGSATSTLGCSDCNDECCSCTDGFFGSVAECQQTCGVATRYCKQDKCKDVDNYNGFWCTVATACYEGLIHGCELVKTEGTVWDRSQRQCIRCLGKEEEEVCGDTSATYIAVIGACVDTTCGTGTNGQIVCTGVGTGTAKCESACGSNTACDEVLDGGTCTAGLWCEKLLANCDGTQKCVNCECIAEYCGDSIVQPARGEDCETDADCTAPSTCMPPGDPNECKCTDCGNGIIDAGEECDPPSDGTCTGANSNGVGSKVCKACVCQDCGDARITGDEECDVSAPLPPGCTGCSSGCTCTIVGPPPGGSCTVGDSDSQTIGIGGSKTMVDGTIKVENVGSGDAVLDITTPWGTLYDDVYMNKGDVNQYFGSQIYEVELFWVTDFTDVTVKVRCNALPAAEICNDNIDNDGDGDTDCEDSNCPAPACNNCQNAVCDSGGTYDWSCQQKGGAACDADADCGPPVDWRCDLVTCTCKQKREFPAQCADGIDNDGDGCIGCGIITCDIECGGIESNCFDGIDNNCDYETDCEDPDCSLTAISCNPKCQTLGCNPALGGGGWFCQTKATVECSVDSECSAPKDWCNPELCKCDYPPPLVKAKNVLQEAACNLIVLLQAISVGIAVLIMIIAGLKWMGSGMEDPRTRTEAANMIKAVFVGLIIILIALQAINEIFGDYLVAILCPP